MAGDWLTKWQYQKRIFSEKNTLKSCWEEEKNNEIEKVDICSINSIYTLQENLALSMAVYIKEPEIWQNVFWLDKLPAKMLLLPKILFLYWSLQKQSSPIHTRQKKQKLMWSLAKMNMKEAPLA